MSKPIFEFMTKGQTYEIELTDGMDPIEICFDLPDKLCDLDPIVLCVSGNTDVEEPIVFPENSCVVRGKICPGAENFIRMTAIKEDKVIVEIFSFIDGAPKDIEIKICCLQMTVNDNDTVTLTNPETGEEKIVPCASPLPGATLTSNDDGTLTFIDKDGNEVIFKAGWTTYVINADGTTTVTYPDGTETIVPADLDKACITDGNGNLTGIIDPVLGILNIPTSGGGVPVQQTWNSITQSTHVTSQLATPETDRVSRTGDVVIGNLVGSNCADKLEVRGDIRLEGRLFVNNVEPDGSDGLAGTPCGCNPQPSWGQSEIEIATGVNGQAAITATDAAGRVSLMGGTLGTNAGMDTGNTCGRCGGGALIHMQGNGFTGALGTFSPPGSLDLTAGMGGASQGELDTGHILFAVNGGSNWPSASWRMTPDNVLQHRRFNTPPTAGFCGTGSVQSQTVAPLADYVQTWNDNGEFFVMDNAGTTTQLSSHPSFAYRMFVDNGLMTEALAKMNPPMGHSWNYFTRQGVVSFSTGYISYSIDSGEGEIFNAAGEKLADIDGAPIRGSEGVNLEKSPEENWNTMQASYRAEAEGYAKAASEAMELAKLEAKELIEISEKMLAEEDKEEGKEERLEATEDKAARVAELEKARYIVSRKEFLVSDILGELGLDSIEQCSAMASLTYEVLPFPF